MHTSLLISVIADDRPGLVDSLSAVVNDHGGNWLESNMSRLAGKFAGILRIDVSASDAPRLEAALQGLSSQLDGLKLQIEQLHADPEPLQEASEALVIELVANDRAGIVSEISRTLAELKINVESFSSFCEPAPMASGQLFRARLEIRMPNSLKRGELRARLELLADDLMLELVD